MEKFKFGKREMKHVIEGYYKKYEDFDGVFSSSCSLQAVGYGMSEHEDAVIEMKIKGKFNVLGMEVEMSRDVSDEDVFNIFRVVLGDAGYDVNSVTFDKGTTEMCEGYYMNERIVSKPYFRGVIVGVTQKTLVR